MRQRWGRRPAFAATLWVVWLIGGGALAAEPKAKPVDTTVRISSVPSGAYVMICPGGEFDDKRAAGLGKTPLLRLMPLQPEGQSIQITKPGFAEWTGRLAPGTAEIKAELIPLTAEQKQTRDFVGSPPCRCLTAMPIRMRIHKIGSPSTAVAPGTDTAEFTNRFVSTFTDVLQQRFSDRASFQQIPELTSEDFWTALEQQMNGVRLEKIGYYPVPLRLNFAPETNARLAAIGGAILLIRAEAHYLGGGTVFARSLVPLILSAGSAYAGYSGAMATGASSFDYYVVGPMPSRDTLGVQLLMIHSQTREVLWYGQVVYPQYFKHKGVTEEAARKAAEQIPAALLKRP